MNRVDLHPEQLFDQLRDGSINSDDYGLLQTHCGICAPCRLELRLVFEPMGAPRPDHEDVALGIAVVDRMLHSPVSHVSIANDANDAGPVRDPRVGAPVSAFRRGRRAAFIAAGTVLGCSMTAAALVPNFSTNVVSAVVSMVGLSSPAKSRVQRRVAVEAEHEPSAPSALQPASRGVLAESSVHEAVGPRADRSANSRRAAQGRSSKAGIDGADSLLAAAAGARARGAYAEAADYYRMLQRHYPNSEAEIVARVSLGRLLCLRLAQPEDALALFDGYLSQRPDGALGQEARSGRAQCLERLGRVDDARTAWEELVEHHPNSVYAEEARVRLALP